ncbi:MAG: hypothetical protein U0L26_09395 [Cellulosilyticum sp.]|nr:hypothetical protein [Cellulosilyticum sp.]MEE1072577.1 hypothetical protein [Cellulosilyticum sp.]
MLFNFCNQSGQVICTIEAHDKIKAKGIYKKMHKEGEVKVPPTQVIISKHE